MLVELLIYITVDYGSVWPSVMDNRLSSIFVSFSIASYFYNKILGISLSSWNGYRVCQSCVCAWLKHSLYVTEHEQGLGRAETLCYMYEVCVVGLAHKVLAEY